MGWKHFVLALYKLGFSLRANSKHIITAYLLQEMAPANRNVYFALQSACLEYSRVLNA